MDPVRLNHPRNCVLVIPAYQPAASLCRLVETLLSQRFREILVVNDGSDPACAAIFDRIASLEGVRVLTHAVNLGKGAALKTAFNAALVRHPEIAGVVTADADGQHHPEDIARVADRLESEPGVMVIGARQFRKDVPLRSRVGNLVTRRVVHLLLGQRLGDTQTGLRGIPRDLLPALLSIPSTGYEYELDMLITAKHGGIRIVEEPIRTIYIDGNRSSHFNPVLDSLRITFVLFRFSILALLTALIDNTIFWLVFRTGQGIGVSQIAARGVALIFNYTAARRAVFLSKETHRVTLPRYLLVVLGNGLASYALIHAIIASFDTATIWAKLTAEGLLFLINFAIQRDYVFTRSLRKRTGEATDWTRYYQGTPVTARLTRRYTVSVLVSALRRCATAKGDPVEILEFGGANSCFLDRIRQDVPIDRYHVIDNNDYGLDLLRERLRHESGVSVRYGDVLRFSPEVRTDVVFSVGLIEHFDTDGTRRAVQSHFDSAAPDGWVILSFPTPTWLYRAARALCEAAGFWKFPDERPLTREEVLAAVGNQGSLIFEKTLWPLVFTQHLMVFRCTKAHAYEAAASSPRP
ncbi:MAG: glycosyltransferase [Bryobacteraceae bacterium]